MIGEHSHISRSSLLDNSHCNFLSILSSKWSIWRAEVCTNACTNTQSILTKTTGCTHGSLFQKPDSVLSSLHSNVHSGLRWSIPPNRCMPTSLAAYPQFTKHYMSTPPKQPNRNSQPAQSILAQQRLRRPLAPHLTIYKPQITSTLSVLMRLTGLALSGSFCIFPMMYLASPYLGLDLSVASLAESFGGLPLLVKVPIKLSVAWIFTFHGFNSLRFLSWKFAIGVTNRKVAQTGWGVVLVSFLGALVLATKV